MSHCHLNSERTTFCYPVYIPYRLTYLVVVVDIRENEVGVQSATNDDFQQRLILVRCQLTIVQKFLKRQKVSKFE